MEFKCKRTRNKSGNEVYQFTCPKCGEKRTHSAEDGHRMSHCNTPNLRADNLVGTTYLPDCWPNGYYLSEDSWPHAAAVSNWPLRVLVTLVVIISPLVHRGKGGSLSPDSRLRRLPQPRGYRQGWGWLRALCVIFAGGWNGSNNEGED